MENTNPPPTLPPAAPQKTNEMAIVSLVTGILGISPAAIITGHIAQSQIKKSGGTLGGNGLAIAGLILGYLGLVIWLCVCVGASLPFLGISLFGTGNTLSY